MGSSVALAEDNLRSALGLVVLLGLAWAMSEGRRAVPWRAVGLGLALTLGLAVLFLKASPVRAVAAAANAAVDAVAAATRAGTSLVFGYVGGGPLPFESKVPGAEFILAFQALPTALVLSVLTTLLFHWRVLPPVVQGFAWLLRRSLGVSGPVGLATAANVVLGMVEAPLFIRPYLGALTRSELFVVMTGGMAGIAGTVFVIYATLLRDVIPDVAGHLVVASVLGAPAAILVSQIMVPEREAATADAPPIALEPVAASTMDAIVKGTEVGIALLVNIVGMLIVFVALAHLANAVLALGPEVGGAPVTLQRVLGIAMAPLCWLMGVPWAEASTAGALMGVKTVLNEFVAYVQMAALPPEALSPRSRLIMLYALCGFANLGSLGILVGGLAAMAPARRAEILELGPRSIVSGTLSTCLVGAMIGLMT